jgi:multisubunit Na+/H+ antiporter MnhC subunit
MIGYLPYILVTAVFLVGLYCAISKQNLVKVVVGLLIAGCALNLFLVTLGYNRPAARMSAEVLQEQTLPPEGIAPIETSGATAAAVLAMADPVPQAMAMASLVVSLAGLALAVAICLRLYDRYRTFDLSEIKRSRE